MKDLKEVKELLASRTVFFKSYIKNIRPESTRVCAGHVMAWVEHDYSFDYKGKRYVCEERIVPDENGEVKYSAKFEYVTKEI